MSPGSCFHNLIWKFSAFCQFSRHNQSLQCNAKIVVIIIQHLYFNCNYCSKPHAFLENMNSYLFSEAITRHCMIYVGNLPQKGFRCVE